MNTRPKPGETEKDILKLQAEFLKNQFKPSAQVVNCRDEKETKTSTQPEIKEQNVVSEPILIGSIIERNTNNVSDSESVFPKFTTGFPQAKRRQVQSCSKKGSLFSQQSKKLKENQASKTDNKSVASNINLPSKSFLLSGRDCDDIHKENIETLSKMSQQEILEEQKKLLSSLDPDIVKFLKSKRKPVEEDSSDSSKMDIDAQVDLEPTVPIEAIETPKEIIETSVTENWLHFDLIETEKLQWMKNIKIPNQPENSEQYEARFNFEGWLLPFSDPEISESNRILYHHGEEPGRPGYTIKELFKLCRSNVVQQRILALNTIANILSLNSTGIYDHIIDIPIEQIFFVIRLSLDDNMPTVLNASIKAMHHLFYYRIDETCLDALLGFGSNLMQPILMIQTEIDNKENENEMNDQQLSEIDLVKCLMRTDILIRIRYIINTVKPTTDTIIYCLELLIRLARDSQNVFLQVYKCEDLISNIIKHFIPKIYQLQPPSNYCYNTPVVSAIKLLRIVASRSKTIAQELITRYSIVDSICSYISNDIGENVFGVKIQIESFNFLAVLFHYNLALDYFPELQPFLIRTFDYHFHRTSIDMKSSYTLQSHFSAVMNIISKITIIDCGLISKFVPLLMQCINKYCAQVSNQNEFECGKLQVISSLFITLANIIKSSPISNDDYVENCLISLLASAGFNKVTENMKFGSNLMCEYEPYKCGANFSSVEAAVWQTSEHIVPVLQKNSCIPFISALSHLIETSSNKLILQFLRHPNIVKYLTSIRNRSKYNLSSNWFSVIESQLLINILKSAVKVQKDLNEPMFYFELTVKCLSVFHISQKSDVNDLLQNIVFNKTFYPSEVLIHNLNLENNENVLTNTLNYLEEIYDCYSKVMGLKKNLFLLTTNLSLDIRIGNFIPVDWYFGPIVGLYSQYQENELKKTDETEQSLIVTRCLQWIFLYETFFADLSAFINQTDRFCRLACVFLCSNSLFLDNDVHRLLELCLKNLIKPENWTRLNFDKQIQGLTNFQDFYTQLLEQYQGVSYGDKLFANFILIPLAQRHNVKWRKTLWSEYMGVAQTIILNTDESCTNLEEFLNPSETDVSLLKCYRRALVTDQLSRCPLLKEIANYHVENYVKNKK